MQGTESEVINIKIMCYLLIYGEFKWITLKIKDIIASYNNKK